MHKFLFHFLNKTTDYKKYVNLNYMPETESKVFKFPAQTPDSLLWSQHFFDSDTFFIRLRLQVFNFSYFSQLRHCISITQFSLKLTCTYIKLYEEIYIIHLSMFRPKEALSLSMIKLENNEGKHNFPEVVLRFHVHLIQ